MVVFFLGENAFVVVFYGKNGRIKLYISSVCFDWLGSGEVRFVPLDLAKF